MKKIILFLLLSLSAPILASDNCDSKLSHAENMKADSLAYTAYIDGYRKETARREELNRSYFGDFLVDDQILKLRQIRLMRADNLIEMKELIFDASLSLYVSCLALENVFISKTEALEDLDVYQIEILKLDKLVELLDLKGN